MVNTFFERFWLFSFSNPRWAYGRAPSINQSSLLYALLLFSIPGWILRVVFPGVDTIQSLLVVGCATLTNICLYRTSPGVFKTYVGTEMVEWHGRSGTITNWPESEFCFTPWTVLKRQLAWVANFFVLGVLLAYLGAPSVLSQGFSFENSWLLLRTGAIVATSCLPVVLMFRFLRWVTRPSYGTSGNAA